jgi:hypothetical protein
VLTWLRSVGLAENKNVVLDTEKTPVVAGLDETLNVQAPHLVGFPEVSAKAAS